ncbi:hypothetical protein LSH36_681g02047 [Paralvinella palmiformis]|uniref:EGF-like domain-containing protein n=1 Tax=Paralvinella palmiformis TaxID=53620 RepID=A0AAD9MWD8_9ANNE|nr:hypothetical protein LSH36_681g02047 [Paralvinella palmiformis]
MVLLWLEITLTEEIDKALESSRLSSVYMYTEILDLVRSEGDDVIVIFDIVLPRSYAPKAYVILADVKWGIRQVLTSSGTDGSNAGLLILERHLEALAVTAVDPCSSSRYNYCDVRADCHATYPTGFVCSCRSGYADISPDIRSNPGERGRVSVTMVVVVNRRMLAVQCAAKCVRLLSRRNEEKPKSMETRKSLVSPTLEIRCVLVYPLTDAPKTDVGKDVAR